MLKKGLNCNQASGMWKVLQKVFLQNWIQSNWVSGSQDKDLLVEKVHYIRFNAINKSEIILARKWFCTLDICIRKSTKIRSCHIDAFFHFVLDLKQTVD
jgi:hypothetical protein